MRIPDIYYLDFKGKRGHFYYQRKPNILEVAWSAMAGFFPPWFYFIVCAELIVAGMIFDKVIVVAGLVFGYVRHFGSHASGPA